MDPYLQTLEYLYSRLPMYQRVGAVAYKNDLTNTVALCHALGNPEKKFKSIHVAGTNGKGSSSHMLAAILQAAGYKTGLYTSPHLKQFTERIKINGQEVSQAFVTNFVSRVRALVEKIEPSFFETTVAMAFDYFAEEQVDIAVIEVGLGGRLDSTNVIEPEVSLITNISFDHVDLLGDTLPKIAAEKAGIIKNKVPVVVSERQAEIESVFQTKARTENSPLVFASDVFHIQSLGDGRFEVLFNNHSKVYDLELSGSYQKKNLCGVLATVEEVRKKGFRISDDHISFGLKNTVRLTGLKGRWQKLADKPLTYCDTGHNEAGINEVLAQLATIKFERLHIVWGVVKDKDPGKVLSLLPKSARYYFCQAKIPRALSAGDLKEKAAAFGLEGEVEEDVNRAIEIARANSNANDFIFIGGSTFVVAEIDNL